MEGIVNAWTSLRDWIGAKRAALRLCVRMTVAGLLAYALAMLFGLPQGYWAVFSAIIIMQASVGGSVKAAIDRLIGTLGGAIAGGVVAFFVPHNDPISLGIALVIALAPLTLVAAINPNYRIAPLTAVIVLLTPGAQQLGPVGSAFYRILEITLGSVIGLVVALLLMPARATGSSSTPPPAWSASSPICCAIGLRCSTAKRSVRGLRSCKTISEPEWRASRS